jgi:hypothetical protein
MVKGGSDKVAKDINFKPPEPKPQFELKDPRLQAAAKTGGKVLKGAGKALGIAGVGLAVYDGIEQTKALDKSSMTKKEYTNAVTGIWASIIAEYGVVTVISMAAATIFGTAGSAVPFIGNIVGAVGGFVGGAVTGLAVDYYYGEEVELATKKFVTKVVDKYWDDKVDGKENKAKAQKVSTATKLTMIDTYDDDSHKFTVGDRSKAKTFSVGDSLAAGITMSSSGQKRGVSGSYADWPVRKPNESDAEYQKRLEKHMSDHKDVDAIAGRTPEQVLATLEQNKELYRGKNIILGTGLPNNQNQIAEVEKELKLLKEIGANVTVLGTGDREDFQKNKLNEKLSALAKKYGFKFTGPLADITSLTPDHVHIKDNEKLLKRIYGEDNQPITQNKNPDVASGSKDVALMKVNPKVIDTQPVVMAQNTVIPSQNEATIMMPTSPIRNLDYGRIKALADSQRVV